MQLIGPKPSAGIRSLVCSSNGIVIAETVYRCMICSEIFEALEDIHHHYDLEHFANEISPGSRNLHFKQAEEIDFENDNFDLNEPVAKPLAELNFGYQDNFQAPSSGEEESNDSEPDRQVGMLQ